MRFSFSRCKLARKPLNWRANGHSRLSKSAPEGAFSFGITGWQAPRIEWLEWLRPSVKNVETCMASRHYTLIPLSRGCKIESRILRKWQRFLFCAINRWDGYKSSLRPGTEPTSVDYTVYQSDKARAWWQQKPQNKISTPHIADFCTIS